MFVTRAVTHDDIIEVDKDIRFQLSERLVEQPLKGGGRGV